MTQTSPFKASTWSRTVDVRTDRKQALLNAMNELPRGVTLDLVIGHEYDCYSLNAAEYSELLFCTCSTLILEATELERRPSSDPT